MTLKSGYQNKRDPMRERAEKMFKLEGKVPEVIISKSKINLPPSPENRFKCGGRVSDASRKFAEGGAAKVRHGQATKNGKPIK